MTTLAKAVLVRGVTECFLCHGDLIPVLYLGEHYLTDFLTAPDASHPKARLDLLACPDCHIMRLGHIVSRDKLFRTYWYRSGVNSTIVAHLGKLAQDLTQRLSLGTGDAVLDIGANDGTFLRLFNPLVKRYGFEPARNLLADALLGGNQVVGDYFTVEGYRAAFGTAKAKLVTSLAMFYDLPEPGQFVEDVRSVLAQDGLWVVEMNYLGDMLRHNAFDFIGHEHVSMYFLAGFIKLVRQHGLSVHDVEFNDLNGGSIRIFVGFPGKRVTTGNVDVALRREAPQRHPEAYKRFANNVQDTISTLRVWMDLARAEMASVYAYGASTRGMTTLQAVGLDFTTVQKAVDKNPEKVGKFMAGVDIPIISEAQFRLEKPAYLLVLPWGFIDEFRQREKAYLDGGGAMIVPMPSPRMVTG